MIPVAAPSLGDLELEYVTSAIRSKWISSHGPFVERFSDLFSRACGVSHALPVSNGTSALHLALLALCAGPGDEVLVPSLAYISVANAVRYVGAIPVFVEIEAGSWGIDAAHMASLITARTKGVIAVHNYGTPCDMDRISEVARSNGLWIIEDAAEAHFATHKGRHVGSIGAIGTFSFYGNKILTCGEGGATITDDDRLADRMRFLRGQAAHSHRRYFFSEIGYNYRLTNVACALICAQLDRLQTILTERRRVHELYRNNLRDVPGISLGSSPPMGYAGPMALPDHDRTQLSPLTRRSCLSSSARRY